MRRILIVAGLLLSLTVLRLSSQIIDPIYEYGSSEYLQSRDMYEQGMLRQSEIDLMEMIRAYPYSAAYDKALLLQAEIDLHSGNHSIALAKLGEFIQTRSNSPLVPHSHLKRAYIEFERNNFEQAEIYFAEARRSAEINFSLRNDSSYKYIAHSALYWQGISLAKQGKQLDALPVFESLVKEYKFGSFADDAQYAIASIKEFNREYSPAITEYRKLQNEFNYRNTYLASFIREANNHLLLRDHRAALLSIERAETTNRIISSKDTNARKYEPQSYCENIAENMLYLRGEAYNMSGNYDMAINSYKDLINRYPKSYLLQNSKLGFAWAYMNKSEYDNALGLYDEVINDTDADNDKNRALAQMFRAVALKRKGDTATARRELSALSMKSNYPYSGVVLLELGQMNYEAGNFMQARRDLERADRESLEGRTAVRVYLLLGATYLELKVYDKAYNEYKRAEQLALNSSEIYLPQKKWYISESRLKQGIALVLSMRSAEAVKPLLAFIADNDGGTQMDEALFWLGESYYRSDLLNNSSQTYKKIIDNYPTSKRREEALYGLGWSHFRLKNFDQSSKVFDQLVKEFPKSPFSVEVLTRQGDGYYLVKNYSKAAESYQKALRLAPNSEEGQYSAYQLAHAYYRLQKFEQSITALLDFVNRYNNSPYSPNALYLIGWIRFQQHKYAECIDNFKFMINAYPQSNLVPRAYYAIADAYYNVGNYDEAIKGYQFIVQTFPSHELAPEAMKSVQFALMAAGRDSEVIAIADQYISSNPNSPYIEDFEYKKIEMFYTGRKYSDAVTEYENFTKKYPDSEKNAEALFLIGKSFINLNEPQKAGESFKKLIKQFPKSDFAPLGLLEYGLLEKQQSRLLQADTIFSNLERNYRSHEAAAQAGFERALIKLSLLDTLGAVNILKRVADDFPTMDYGDHSRYRVAMFYRSKDMYDSARVHFTLLSKVEENPVLASEAQYRLGELWLRSNDCEKAIKEFLIVKENFTGYEDWFSLALLNLGECYEKLENKDLAIEMYTTLEGLRPNDDFGKTAKSRLKRLNK